MRKILLFFLILIPSYSYAQGISINGVAFYNSSGTLRVVPSAVITVCIAVDVSIPCGNTVSIYSDVGLTVPKANPFNADANGNYQYFVASGSSYTETVTGAGVQGFSRQVGGGGSSSGTIGGSLVAGQIPVGSGPNTVAGSSALTFNPLSTIGTLLQSATGGATGVNNNTGCVGFNTVNTMVPTPATDRTYYCKTSDGHWFIDNIGENGTFESIDFFGDGTTFIAAAGLHGFGESKLPATGLWCLSEASECGNPVLIFDTTIPAFVSLPAVAYTTATNCSSSASPAVCGSAAAGSVIVAAAGTSVVVDTSAVTANSQIMLEYDSSLGTKLGVTCNVTEPALYGVSARSAGVSFTITSSSPSVNPACFSYLIFN